MSVAGQKGVTQLACVTHVLVSSGDVGDEVASRGVADHHATLHTKHQLRGGLSFMSVTGEAEARKEHLEL